MRSAAAIAVVLGVVLAGPPGVARAESQVWNALFLQARTGKTSGVSLWFDAHARRRGDGSLFILRPGVGYTFSPALTIHAGYGWIPRITDEGTNTDEDRTWQQAIFTKPVGSDVKLQLRGRLEQRFAASGDDIGHRFRMFARGQWAWCEGLPAQLVAWDEVFVGLNNTDWNTRRGFDQNRLFVGLGTDTRVDGVRVEAGYLNVAYRKPDDGERRVDHAVMVNLFMTLTP